MKKINLFLVTLLVSIICYSQSSSWGRHLNTHDVPSHIYVSPINSNSFTAGAYKVSPDAITSNEGNLNSNYGPNTMFTVHSVNRLGTQSSYNMTNNNRGAWLIAKDQNSGTIFSKLIRIPNKILRIWSLQYNYEGGDEILVFTGSIAPVESEGGNFRQMVVGTYNLSSNLTDIKVVEYSDFCDGGTIQDIASQGVGVRELFDNKFMAIGQIGNRTYNNPEDLCSVLSNAFRAVNPIVVIFDVSSTGGVTIEYKEIKDFLFKPHTVTDTYLTGASGCSGLIVGGLKFFPIDFPETAPNSNHTISAPAAYTFDAILFGGSGWQVSIIGGAYGTTNEYDDFGIGRLEPEIHVGLEDNFPQDRSVFLAWTKTTSYVGKPLERTGDLCFVKFDVDMTTGDYSFVTKKKHSLFAAGTLKEVHGGVQRILSRNGDSYFDVVLNLYDILDDWGRPNRTSIGLTSIDKGTLDQNGNIFYSIYADDVTGESYFETEIRNTTGLRINSVDPKITYLLADADRMETRSARAHFNKLGGQGLGCIDYGLPVYHVLPFGDEMDNDQDPENKSVTISAISSGELTIYGTEWNCNNYLLAQQGFRLKSVPDNNGSNPLIEKIGEDLYQINNLEENIINYQVYSLSGQRVSVKMINNSFNLQGLTPGVYIIQYDAQNKWYSEKLMVQ